jgi:ankyrin repeat protein
LCAQGSDNEIVKALEFSPAELFEIYRRSMQRVSERNQAGQAIKTLQICGVAKRPLSVEELQEALSIEPGQRYMDNGNLPNDMDRVLAACCGLAFVDEEDDTVHYIHQSVKEYLFGRSSEGSDSFSEADLDKHLGVLCLTYLDFNDFQRQLVKQAPSAPINPLKIAMNTTNNKLAQQLLRRSNRFKPMTFEEFGRKAQELLGTTEESRLKSELRSRHFHFLTYAQIYWAFHLRDLSDVTDKKMWTLFCKCVDGCNTMADRPWETYRGVGSSDLEWVKQEPSKIQWLIANNHSALLRYEKASATSSLTENTEDSLLLHSSRRGQISFVEILLNNTRSPHEVLDQAIRAAAEGGHLEVVERLLAANANVNATAGYNGRTALQAAAESGHLEVVERLLAANANVNATARYNGRTALQAAAEGGHLEVVERLLAANADVNTAVAAAGGPNGRTALKAAAEGGHLEVVERLLAASADVNAAAGYNGRTGLQAAAQGGHLKVVERLLAANADVNAVAAGGPNGRTALQAAAEGGHLEVVERLLAANADVNAAAAQYNGRTALQAAAEGGHLEVVERLLVANADVNAAASGHNGQTAFQAAEQGGHFEVVKRLKWAGHRKLSVFGIPVKESLFETKSTPLPPTQTKI